MVQDHRLYERLTSGIDGAGIEASALLGAFVKSVTTGGLATVQLADGTESTVQLQTGGAGAGVPSYAARPVTSYDATTNHLELTIDALAGEALPHPSIIYFLAPRVLPRDADPILIETNGQNQGDLLDITQNPVAARLITPFMLVQVLYNRISNYIIVEPLPPRRQDFLLVCVASYDDDQLTQTEVDNAGSDGPTTSMTSAGSFPEYGPFDPRQTVYFFVGVPQNVPDIVEGHYGRVPTAGTGGALDRVDQFDSITYNGIAYKWWRFRRTRQMTNLGYSIYVEYGGY